MYITSLLAAVSIWTIEKVKKNNSMWHISVLVYVAKSKRDEIKFALPQKTLVEIIVILPDLSISYNHIHYFYAGKKH